MSSPVPLRLSFAARGDAQRAALEAVVREVYAQAYGARIEHLLPVLIGLRDETGTPAGVVGCQTGSEPGAMFLESYLDVPVEARVAEILGRQVPRERLAEVGNLSASGRGLGRLLVTTMAAWLQGAGVEWAVFTATRALRASFRRMGLTLVDLGLAEGARLGEALGEWGNYYAAGPRVTALRVEEMRAAGRLDPELARRGALLWAQAFARGRRHARHAA